MTSCNRYSIDPYSLYNRNQLMNKLGVPRDSVNKIVNDVVCNTDSKIQTFRGIDILLKLYPYDEQLKCIEISINKDKNYTHTIHTRDIK